MAKAFDFDAILYELLDHARLKIAQLLGADRANLFLVEAGNSQAVSIYSSLEEEGFQEKLKAVDGVLDEVINLKKAVNIAFDFYEDHRSEVGKQEDAKKGYRTYTLLAVPVFGSQGQILGIVQVVNKLKNSDFLESLIQRIDLEGFTKNEETLLKEFLPILVPIFEKWRASLSSKKEESVSVIEGREVENFVLQAGEESNQNNKILFLLSAIRKISERSFDLDETLQSVMSEAKKLANSDRSTVWMVDREKNDLWTKISLAGTFQEIRIPMGAGVAGRVAQTGEPMEMEFDFYEHPDSEAAKQADQQTGYRTCSLLCLPIFNSKGELLGVTHLVNKLRLGDFPAYDPDSWPVAPEAWKASFSATDRELIEALNFQAGIILENAKVFENFKDQEILKNEMFDSLLLGVIATNITGHIMAINPKAKELMGFSDADWLEGRAITDLVQIEDGDLSAYLNTAAKTEEGINQLQSYREKHLIAGDKNAKKINLMVQAIGKESDKKSGILLVLEEIFAADDSISSNLGEPKPKKELPKSGKVRGAGESKEITFLYSGMRSFTPLLENLEDVEVSQLLKEYFNSMSEAVIKYNGTIDKYVGDAIMAIFGSPIPQRDHAWCAVQTAIEMRQRLVELNVRRVEDGKQALRIGIGINSDSIADNLSTSGRLELTAVGDTLNVGFYLEKASKQYGCDIIISDSTHRLCTERVWARELDSIRIKGKNEPVAIYQLVALRSEELPEEKVQVIEYYSQGRSYYRNREFSLAAEQFSKVLEISSWDIPAAIQLERCQHWLNSPPPADWDGVWKLTEI